MADDEKNEGGGGGDDSSSAEGAFAEFDSTEEETEDKKEAEESGEKDGEDEAAGKAVENGHTSSNSLMATPSAEDSDNGGDWDSTLSPPEKEFDDVKVGDTPSPAGGKLAAKFEDVAINDPNDTGPRDPIMQEIFMRLECTGCGHQVAPPIQQCPNGHFICPPCLVDLKRTVRRPCPECSVEVKDTAMNFAFGQIAKDCVVPCRYTTYCNVKCRHADLDRHQQYCLLKRKGHGVSLSSAHTGAFAGDEGDPANRNENPIEESDAGIAALAEVSKQIQCSFCAEVCPAPVHQCKNGHVSCSFCLERMRKTSPPTTKGGKKGKDEEPKCPFCSVSIKETYHNLHLEEMAASSSTVRCRYENCGVEVKYPQLSEHLEMCEHQPIKCATCNQTNPNLDATLPNWDAMWDHYKERHILNCTKTPLSNMVLKTSHIADMLSGKLGFITWGHSLNDDGEPVRVFPGMYYSKARETFYFTIRMMGPLGDELYGLVVTSPTSSIRMIGYFPAISYRTPHRYTINTPCLAISVATMKLMTDGGEGIKFQISLPENGPQLI